MFRSNSVFFSGLQGHEEKCFFKDFFVFVRCDFDDVKALWAT